MFFEQTTYTVGEGESVETTVILDTDPEQTVDTPIVSTNPDDASASDHPGVPSEVTFESEETRQVVTLTATDDDTDDDGESIQLSFGASLRHRVSAGTVNETTVNITGTPLSRLQSSGHSSCLRSQVIGQVVHDSSAPVTQFLGVIDRRHSRPPNQGTMLACTSKSYYITRQ